jgi:hypothetical protein
MPDGSFDVEHVEGAWTESLPHPEDRRLHYFTTDSCVISRR